MLRWSFPVLLVALAAGFSTGACTPPQPAARRPAPTVGVVTIRPQRIPLTAELPGRTSPFAVSEIRPQVSGLIQKRLFTEGSTVVAGQPLYQIEAAPYQAIYARAQANLAGQQGRAGRYAALTSANAIAPQANEDAQAAYLAARADADAARINLAHTRILAPISGRIGASTVTEGALVTAQQATALATISTLDPIYVDIDQSSSELLALRHAAGAGRSDGATSPATPVRLRMDDGSFYPQEGRLQFTDVMVDSTTGAVRLRALFPNPDGVLLPGLHVSALVTQGHDPQGILALEHGVRRNERGEAIAYVVDRNNVARLRIIRTGRALGRHWQVLDGLKPGDRMIVEGLMKVKADTKVSPRPARVTER